MKKCVVTLGIIGLFIPISIKAGSVSLSCDSTSVAKGGSTTCTLSGSSSVDVSGLSAKLSTTGDVSISNVNTSSEWQGDGSGGSIDLYAADNKLGGFGIATFTLNVNGNGSVSVGGVVFCDADYNENSVSGKTVNITVKEEIRNESTNEKRDNTQLTQNNNSVNNGSSQNVSEEKKEDKKSSDASLKELVISNGTINFDSNVFEYNIEVSHDIDRIGITAVANDSNASVVVPENLLLKDGDNSFNITVMAQDGTKKEYKINIKRLDRELSTDSSLKSLIISGYDIDFNSEKYIYDIGKIESSSLNIAAIANDANAIVKVYGNESIGKNDVIVVEVEAENKTKTQYIIYVSNTKKESMELVYISFVLLLVSLGFNGFFIFRNYKKRD